MALTQDAFTIPAETLDALNAAIEQAVSDYYRRSPDADPLDAMSVTFNFVFGWGRELNVYVAGKHLEFDLD